MIYINTLEENQKLFEALASPTRIKIIELLQNTPAINMDSLAKSLNISNGAMTSHIKKLANCGLVNTKLASIGHGTQKLCSLAESKIVIDLIDKTTTGKYTQLEFNVGQYAKCKASPTCGLANTAEPLFEFDIPQFFKYPEHFNAELIWFTDGYVIYTFPNPLENNILLTELQISFEISSEGPLTAKDCPSAIDFYSWSTHIGRYDCPGEFAEHKGRFTPDWWLYGQYGQLINIAITCDGTYINGAEASPYSIKDLLSDGDNDELLQFKISCQDRTSTKGGITLFGKGFGDYPQGIVMKAFYS